MDWISVEAELPDKQDKWDGKSFVVALFRPHGLDHLSAEELSQFNPIRADRVQAMTTTYLHNYLEEKIVVQTQGKLTHWMPLPKPPEE